MMTFPTKKMFKLRQEVISTRTNDLEGILITMIKSWHHLQNLWIISACWVRLVVAF